MQHVVERREGTSRVFLIFDNSVQGAKIPSSAKSGSPQ